MIVEQNGKFRGVQPEIFLRTYRLQDGRQIASLTSDLKVWSGRNENVCGVLRRIALLVCRHTCRPELILPYCFKTVTVKIVLGTEELRG